MSLDSATKLEKKHLERIKNLPCGVCGDTNISDAHHIKDGDRRISHYATIPLCHGCHENLHYGDRAMWKIHKINEIKVLAETIQRLLETKTR